MKFEISRPTDIEQNECEYNIFLVGGCSTNWRDIVINFLNKNWDWKDLTFTVNVFDPFVDTKKIKLHDLLKWEHDKIIKSDLLVYNFEGSESVQPGTIFELGRFLLPHNKQAFINISSKYKLYREVICHIENINNDVEQHIPFFPNYLRYPYFVDLSNEQIAIKIISHLVVENQMRKQQEK